MPVESGRQQPKLFHNLFKPVNNFEGINLEDTPETPQISASKLASKQPLSAVKDKKPTKKDTRFRLGRPTKYKVAYCQGMIDYFTQDLYHERIKSVITQKNGSTIENYELVPNPPIFIGEYAYSIGVTKTTLHQWKKLYSEFNSAYTRAKELQQEHINKLANMGLFNSQYAQFTMKNISPWRDKKDLEVSGKVDAQLFFADLLAQADEALRNEREVLGASLN